MLRPRGSIAKWTFELRASKITRGDVTGFFSKIGFRAGNARPTSGSFRGMGAWGGVPIAGLVIVMVRTGGLASSIRMARCEAVVSDITIPSSTTTPPEIALPTTFLSHTKNVILSLFRLVELLFLFTPSMLASPLLLFPGWGRHWWRVVLVWTLNEAGPTFQKLGQWASTRPDLFGAATRADFEAFHSEIPPEPWSVTKRTIEDAIAPNQISDLFADISTHPVGAGCVALVFKGRLVGSNTTVALKVRRHDVAERITRDCRLLCSVANILERVHPIFKWIAVAEQAENFSTFLLSQLDLRVEGRHLLEFARKFEGNTEVTFPTPILSFKELLIETFEQGTILSKLLALDKAATYDSLHDRLPEGLRQAIGKAGVHAFLQMFVLLFDCISCLKNECKYPNPRFALSGAFSTTLRTRICIRVI